MNKLLLTLMAASILTTATAQQKHNLFTKPDKTEKTGRHHWVFPPRQNALNKTTSGNRLKSYSVMSFDETISQLVYSDSAIVNYTGSYGGGYAYNNDGSDVEDMLSNLTYNYYFPTSGGGAGSKYDLGTEYDLDIKYDNGEFYTYDTSIATWVNEEIKVQAAYGAGGNMLTYEYQYFDSSTSTWSAYMKYLFAYDAAGRCSSIDMLFWDGAQLANLLRNEYTYNANSQASEIVAKLWDAANNNWENNDRLIVNYSGGKISSIESDYWDGNAWQHNEGYLCHYGANGYIQYVENGYWDPSSSSYLYDYKNTFTYDAGNRVATQTLEYLAGSQYVNYGKCEYSYNADNYITRIFDYEWDQFSSAYTPYEKYNYYYESYTTGIADVKNHGGSVSVYPSPANDILNISLKWEEQQAFSVSITDIQGRVWVRMSNKPSKEYNGSVNIESLPSGNYQVTVQGAKGKIVQKVSVLH